MEACKNFCIRKSRKKNRNVELYSSCPSDSLFLFQADLLCYCGFIQTKRVSTSGGTDRSAKMPNPMPSIFSISSEQLAAGMGEEVLVEVKCS